jgi:hypothetical protein
MGDVAPRPHQRIVLHPAAACKTNGCQSGHDRDAAEMLPVLVCKQEEFEQRVVRKLDAAIHIGFAESELRIAQEGSLCPCIAEEQLGEVDAPSTVVGDASIRPDHFQPALPEDLRHQAIETTIHVTSVVTTTRRRYSNRLFLRVQEPAISFAE